MKLNIAVIFGGRSVEHEVSIISAIQCINALDTEKYNAIPIYITKSGIWYTGDKLNEVDNFRDTDKLLTTCKKIFISQNADDGSVFNAMPSLFGKKILAKIDVAFPVIHGTNGEDGVLQGFLELMNIPYVGCNVLASAVTMDKITTQQLLRTISVPVLDNIWFYSNEWIDNKDDVLKKITTKFSYPLIVKPSNLGSSIGVSAAKNQQELEDAIDLVVSMSQRVLIEPKIENLREINCAVLGDYENVETSVCEELIKSVDILSFKDKYLSGEGKCACNEKTGELNSSTRKVPADLSKEVTKEIEEIAKKAFLGLNCSGVSRIDFLIDQNTNKTYLCEINTIPGSLSFHLWKPKGKNFTDLTTRLIELALKKHREKNNLILTYTSNILQNFQGAKGKL